MRRLKQAWNWVKNTYAKIRIRYLKWKWQRKYGEDISQYKIETDDFFEEDEALEKIIILFEENEKGTTAPPPWSE